MWLQRADGSYTATHIAVGGGHISLFVVGNIGVCTIVVQTRRSPICLIIGGVYELVGLVIRVASAWQEDGVVGLAAGKEHTMDAIDHHIIPVAILDEFFPLLL